MSFLVSIGLWLVKLASSDLAKLIFTTIANDLIATGKEELPYVQAAVEEAMKHDDWRGTQKLSYVQDTIKARFPNISNALLNRLIENVSGALGLQASST